MSLLRIALRDFVIVQHLELELGRGFTALTGETGAGKSILIDALQLALGGRADAGVVRTGQTKADVSAEFATTAEVQAWLAAQELQGEEETLWLRRTVDAQGRSKGWINGTAASAAQMREVGGMLVDIHGQHAWQALMRADTTRALLDGHAGIDTGPLAALWRTWRDAEQALETARANHSQAEARREHLAWQLAECQKLTPQPGQWAQLQTEHVRLAHIHHVLEAAAVAWQLLGDAEVNALDLMRQAQSQLDARAHQEPAFAQWVEQLEQAAVLQKEVARGLQAYSRNTEADPQRLAQVEQRLAQWLAVARRLGCPPEEVPEAMRKLQDELAELTEGDATGKLQAHAQRCHGAFMAEAERISALRQAACVPLATEITERMQQLGMAGGQFVVVLTGLPEPQAHGLEVVEFRVAGHAGVEPRAIGKVASGGELSRIALAISVATSQVRGCPTLIFDEVDAGVGGAVAHTVGQLMANLGAHRQVLAVTHLPQVAACADAHWRVAKAEQPGGGVLSSLVALDAANRVEELARMLGGATVTETTRAHAREMLQA